MILFYWIIFFNLKVLAIDPLSQPCAKCGINENFRQALTYYQRENVLDVSIAACKSIRESEECQGVARELRKRNEDPHDFLRRCDKTEVSKDDVDTFFRAGRRIWGCTGLTILDMSVTDTFHMVDDVLRDHQEEKFCNSRLEYKKALYDAHNIGLPDDYKIPYPSDSKLKAFDCSDIKRSIYEAERFIIARKGHPPDSQRDLNSGVLSFIKSKIHETGIELDCYNPERAWEMVCKTAAVVFTGVKSAPALLKGVRALAGLGTFKEGSELLILRNSARLVEAQKEAESVESVVSSEEEKEFIANNKMRSLVDPKKAVKQNRAWMNFARKEEESDRTIWVDEENAVLKDINSERGKSFGTAVTNKRKDIFEAEIEKLVKKYDVKVLRYSDFKSIRFAFTVKKGQKITKEFEEDLAAAFGRANHEFEEYLTKNKLIRYSKVPVGNWFRAGMGRTADQASFAASGSRDMAGANRLVHFDEEEMRTHFTESLKGVHEDYDQIIHDPNISVLVENMKGSSQPMLKTDVFDALRKYPEAEDLKDVLNKTYGINLTDPQVSLLRSYYRGVNKFVPPLHIAERLDASMTTANHGGIAVDFRGLGALGRRRTAEALTVADKVSEGQNVASQKIVNKTINLVRTEEVSLTKQINRQKRGIAKVIEETLDAHGISHRPAVISGDDMVVIPNEPIPEDVSREIAAKLAMRKNPSRIRVTDLRPGQTDPEYRNHMVDVGEALEKETRTRVLGQVDDKKMKKVVLIVEMSETPTLVIGGGRSSKLSDAELKLIHETFLNTLKDLPRTSTGQFAPLNSN